MNVKELIRELTTLETQGFGDVDVVAFDANGYIHDTIRIEHDVEEGQVTIFVEEA